MKNIILFSLLLPFYCVVAQETNTPPVSLALEELFGADRKRADQSVAEQLYLKVIPSRTSERSTLIYRCRHVTASSITYPVESATSATGTVETSDDQNMITVNDVNEQIEELTELLMALDRRGPQVMVEAQIVELQMGEGEKLDSAFNFSYHDKDKDALSSAGSMLGGIKGYPGRKGEYPGVTPGFPDESGSWFDLTPLNKELSNGDIIKINAKLRWLQSNDKAEILSSPNLLVDLGTTATVSTGTDQPLLSVSVNNGVSQEEVYYKRTGVNLRVTPLLVNNDTVTIEVRPEVTSVVGSETLSSSSTAPIISVRNIETKLNVRDGGVVMMGGLYSSKDIQSEEKVPWLGDLPILGYLFRSSSFSEEQVQLVFLLRVSIVPDSPVTLLSNMDSTKRELKGVGAVMREELNRSVQGKAEVEAAAEEVTQ